MPRIAALVAAAVMTALWLRLERPQETGAALAVAALGLSPMLVPRFRVRLAAAALALLAAAGIAFHESPLRHPGAIVTRFANGFLGFYDVTAPFDPRPHSDMAATVLTGIFAFCLATSLAVATRRAGLAVLALLVGAGWPATLVSGGNEVGRGALILVAVLVVLVALTRRPASRAAVPAVAVLALIAAAASTSSAVAKHELVAWQRWDFYTHPDKAVGVSYVWDAQYDGLRWPKKRTVVLRVAAPATSLYWRATTLDTYANDRWIEQPAPRALAPSGVDPLLPRAARDSRRLVRVKVTVAALADTHLVGPGDPVRFDAGGVPLLRPAYGVAEVDSGLPRGFTYTVESYTPKPGPRQLVRSLPLYPRALTAPGGALDLEPGLPAPAFGTPSRLARLDALLSRYSIFGDYRPLAAVAERVAGKARTPYAAAVAVESWLRFRGGFSYSNRPPLAVGLPPLVGFVTQTKRGYCQHFAGAMALMLRYLGVPARVAVGFTSGTYDSRKHEWTVSDHDAHAWVEVWFRGYGWLSFDPTPGRGRLSAPYSAGSPGFLKSAGRALAAALGVIDPAAVGLGRSDGRRRVRVGFGADLPFAGSPRTSRRPSGDSLVALLVLLVAGAATAVTLAKIAVRRARYLSRDPRRLASACRRELVDFLLDQRIEEARGATLYELAALVHDELGVDATAFVGAASAARFGPPADAAEAARRARRELRTLERRLRASLSGWARARGLFSLRSLGIAAT